MRHKTLCRCRIEFLSQNRRSAMDDREKKSPSPVPSKEECDAAYSKARTSLDGRASPFVPGLGRVSQDLNSIDLNGERTAFALARYLQGTNDPPRAHKRSQTRVAAVDIDRMTSLRPRRFWDRSMCSRSGCIKGLVGSGVLEQLDSVTHARPTEFKIRCLGV